MWLLNAFKILLVYYDIPYKYDNNMSMYMYSHYLLGNRMERLHKVTNAKDDNDEKMMINPTKDLTTQINNMRSTKSNKPKCDFFFFYLLLPSPGFGI